MKIRKYLALVLALCMAVVLCACSGTYIVPYDTGTEETTPSLDFDAAWARHDPDEVMFYVNGESVTWRELFYEITYFTQVLSASEGVAVQSWDQLSTTYNAAYGDVVLQNAVSTLVQYHAMHQNLVASGVTLSQESREKLEETRRSMIDTNFGGDEQAFIDYLASLYCTEELWQWFNEVDALYAYDGFDTLYGAFGSDLPDEAVYEYAAGDPNGVWPEYVELKQIWLYAGEEDETPEESAATEEPESAATEEPTAETSGDPTSEEPVVTADDIVAALDRAEDKEAAFDELYARYNENDAVDVYAGGRCVYEGDVDDAIYEAALALGEYGYTVVTADGADVVVMRVPIEPDAGVVFDETTGTMYTLRYYAAWQAYSNLINGDEGWLASAQTSWVGDFGDFNLPDAFAAEEPAADEAEGS